MPADEPVQPTDSTPPPGPFRSDSSSDYRSLIESARDIIVVFALDGRLLYTNRAGLLATGYAEEEARRLTLVDLVAPEEIENVLARRRDRHAGRGTLHLNETVIRTRAGEPIPVEGTVAPIKWRGEPAEVIVVRDIRERRLAERLLNHRANLLKAVSVAAKEFLVATTWEERCVGVLESLAQAAGVSTAFLWEFRRNAAGEVVLIRRYAWTDQAHGPGQEGPVDDLEIAQDAAFPAFARSLQRDGVVHLEDCAAVAPLRSFLSDRGVRRLIAIPVLPRPDLWGMIGFRHHVDGRGWNDSDLEALRGVADVLSGLIRRAKAERAHEEIHARYEAAFQQAPEGILMIDPTGVILDANPALCSMVGRPLDELRHLRLFEITPEEIHPEIEASLETTRTGRPFRGEGILVRADGTRVPVDVSASQTRDGNFQAIIRDLSDKKETERRLLRSRSVLETIQYVAERSPMSEDWEDGIRVALAHLGRTLEASRVFIHEIRIGPDGDARVHRRYTWGAARFEQLAVDRGPSSYSVRETGIQGLLELFRTGMPSQGHARDFPPKMKSLMEASGFKSIVTVPILVEGICWGYLGVGNCSHEQRWSPEEIDALRVVAGVIGNLVQRRRTVLALRESEARYRGMVEGANQPILIVDRDGVFHFANTTAAAMVGRSPLQMVGRRMEEVFPVDVAERHVGMIRKAIDEDRLVVEVAPTVLQGEVRWFESRIQPLSKTGERPQGAILLAYDVTERKKSEEQLMEYQQRLRAMASELAMAEQRERRRLAVEVHDRIGQTLAAIKMKIESILQSEVCGRTPCPLTELRPLVDQCVRDTRSISFELSPPVLYDLGLIPALEWLAEHFGAAHGIETRFEGDDAKKPLSIDSQILLFEATREVLSNVHKHASARFVRVRALRRDSTIAILVEDDGVGFDPRSVEPSAPSIDSGFGLFSIRERLRLVGGSLSIDSKPGSGSRVTMELPLSEESGV